MSQDRPLPRLLLALPIGLGGALAALFWFGLSYDQNQYASRLINKPLPFFSLQTVDMNNTIINSTELKGPAIINIWATWCTACVAEHPRLKQLSQDKKLTIYGINYQDEKKRASEFLETQGNPFKINLFDGIASTAMSLDVLGLPQTYAIDNNGIIRFRHIGELNDTVIDALKSAIAQ